MATHASSCSEKQVDLQRSVRVLRIYLDGAYGIGKSTCASVMTESVLYPTLYAREPMAYWRRFFFPSDIVSDVYSTQERRRTGKISEEDADAVTTSLQVRFASPYLTLHAATRALFGQETCTQQRPDITLIFDRHPIAAILCFPAARYVVGDMSIEAFLALISTLPEDSSGANIVIADITEEEHVRRLQGRNRRGERIDMNLLRALRNIYIMLINTISYARLRSQVSWRDDWDSIPTFDDTVRDRITSQRSYFISEPPQLRFSLLTLLKTPAICDDDGFVRRIHELAIDNLMNKLALLHVYYADFDNKTPKHCAESIRCMTTAMSVTTTSYTNVRVLEDLIKDFNNEMSM
ncbi:thymidine kinase [Spheniscid alphaherpesvirus 1]|uniref:Thymidine kinase n=1 Tax=Spheniscid alphaherpesvirus 1 TaxID=2560777 RepID=A0A1R3TAJ5_9ALPH|nr:thymidine kinase [Spheniscid alphaherpesvirus 1]